MLHNLQHNLTMYVDMLHKTLILVKLGHILRRKLSSGFPSDAALSVCSLLFSEFVPNNDPLLQLQLRSAGSIHVAFRDLRELQS